MIQYFRTIIILALALLIVACGGEEQSCATSGSVALLPGSIDSLQIEKSSEPRLFVGDSLWEYINGGAEVYHAFNFVGVATADYTCDHVELTVDIYSFEDADDAYGLYSALRPEDASIVDFGVEGFITGNTLDFVKGRHLVRLVGFDESQETRSAINRFAPALNELVPGSSELPETFALFPNDSRVVHTERIYSESFLGQRSMTEVYTIDCMIGADRITLFLTPDSAGVKFDEWVESSSGFEKPATEPIPVAGFDSDQVVFEDFMRGTILSGRKGDYIIGIAGYNNSLSEFFTEWLELFN